MHTYLPTTYYLTSHRYRRLRPDLEFHLANQRVPFQYHLNRSYYWSHPPGSNDNGISSDSTPLLSLSLCVCVCVIAQALVLDDYHIDYGCTTSPKLRALPRLDSPPYLATLFSHSAWHFKFTAFPPQIPPNLRSQPYSRLPSDLNLPGQPTGAKNFTVLILTPACVAFVAHAE
jgi:hypothetical protein